MQRITRREFLKYRMESLTKVSPFDPSSPSPSSSPSSTVSGEERVKLAHELRSVSDQLRKDLPEYEITYPILIFTFNIFLILLLKVMTLLRYQEKFMYRNVHYSEALGREG